jgi:hypothetical protein
MNEIDVLEELMKDDPFLRLYPTFAHYVRDVQGVSLDLALEFYASHVCPEKVVELMTLYRE